MRRKPILVVLVASALAAGGGAGALADTATHTDPAGDVRGGGSHPDYDLRSAGHAHANGFLVHTVVTRGRHTDDSPAPELLIRVGRGVKPDFRVTGAGVFRLGTGAGGRKVGRARLTRPGPRSQRLLFRAAAINSPREYDWKVLMGVVGSISDVAPAHYATHVLR
jgi:hypothetical protein